MNQIPARDKGVKYLFASARHENVDCVRHLHATAEIITVSEGCVKVGVSDKIYDLEAGYGIFMRPYEPHEFHTEGTSKCHVFMFSRELIEPFMRFIDRRTTLCHIFAVSPSAEANVQRILPNRFNEADYIGADAALAPLIYDARTGCEFGESVKRDDTALGLTLNFIEDHFLEDISLDTVAHAIGQHPVTVSKMLSGRLGIGFVDHIRYLRCQYAANLIKRTDKSLTEISYECGFGSTRSFNRAFIATFGLTPTEYRQDGIPI